MFRFFVPRAFTVDTFQVFAEEHLFVEELASEFIELVAVFVDEAFCGAVCLLDYAAYLGVYLLGGFLAERFGEAEVVLPASVVVAYIA